MCGSIRSVITTLTLLISLSGIALAGWNIYEATSAYQRAQKISESNTLGSDLLKASVALAEERGMIYTVLMDAHAASPQLVQDIMDRRKVATDSFAKAMQQMAAWDFSPKQKESIKSTADLVASLDEMRALTDGDLSLPMETRQYPAIVSQIIPGMEKAAEAIQSLRQLIGFGAASGPSAVYAFENLQNQVWAMSEYAARERAFLAGLIQRNVKIVGNRQEKLAGYRGQIMSAWRDITATVDKPYLQDYAAEIDASLAQVNTVFFQDLSKVRRKIFRAGTSKRIKKYPLTTEQWIAASTAGNSAILGLGAAVVTASELMVADVSSAALNSLIVSVMVMIVIVVTVVFMQITVGRIVSAISAMSSTMTELATGKTDLDVPFMHRKDECGQMAKAVNVFKDSTIERDRLQKEEEARNLQRLHRQQRVEELTQDFDSMVTQSLGSVLRSGEHLHKLADALEKTADMASEKSVVVSSATEEATVNVNSVSTASNELSSSIEHIAAEIQKTGHVLSDATDKADTVNQKISNLANEVDKIGGIVVMINDVAEQTNLLALNATIEAARAGEAGKGFAVVANEVKNLASQTGRATEEISTQVSSVQKETGDAVSSIREVLDLIGDIQERSQSVAEEIDLQTSATMEIAHNISEAARGTEEVASNIGGVASAAQETEGMAHELNQAANELMAESKELRKKVEHFLVDMRSVQGAKAEDQTETEAAS